MSEQTTGPLRAPVRSRREGGQNFIMTEERVMVKSIYERTLLRAQNAHGRGTQSREPPQRQRRSRPCESSVASAQEQKANGTQRAGRRRSSAGSEPQLLGTPVLTGGEEPCCFPSFLSGWRCFQNIQSSSCSKQRHAPGHRSKEGHGNHSLLWCKRLVVCV